MYFYSSRSFPEFFSDTLHQGKPRIWHVVCGQINKMKIRKYTPILEATHALTHTSIHTYTALQKFLNKMEIFSKENVKLCWSYIMFANNMDQDQAPRNVGPDLRFILFDTQHQFWWKMVVLYGMCWIMRIWDFVNFTICSRTFGGYCICSMSHLNQYLIIIRLI